MRTVQYARTSARSTVASRPNLLFAVSAVLLFIFLIEQTKIGRFTELLLQPNTNSILHKDIEATQIQRDEQTPPRKPFDPFSDFTFRVVKEGEEKDDDNFFFSTHHCVGTGDHHTFTQSEQDSYKNRRPNHTNRQCYYKNLYYRLRDQTFHYFASPEESKMLEEARKAEAAAVANPSILPMHGQKQQEHVIEGSTTMTNCLQNHYQENYVENLPSLLYTELVDRMNVQIGDALDTDKHKKLMYQQPWRPIIHEHNSKQDIWKTLSSTSLVNDGGSSSLFAVVDIKHQDEGSVDVETNGKKKFYFVLNRPYHSMNLGHMIYDDIFSVFSLYDRLASDGKENQAEKKNTDDDDLVIPFFVELPDVKRQKKNFGGPDKWYRCSPSNFVKWEMCVKTYKRLYAPFLGVAPDHCSGDILRSGNWLRGDEAIGTWENHKKDDSCLVLDHGTDLNDETAASDQKQKVQEHQKRNKIAVDGEDQTTVDRIEYVMIPNVLAGTGRLGQFSCVGDCAIGRTKEIYGLRNYVVRNVMRMFGSSGGEETSGKSKNAKAGYILFSMPYGSSRPDQVYLFENEIKEAISRYGDHKVKVVDLATLSIKDQVLLLDETAVLITNQGGSAGAAALFLHTGSSAIVYWYPTKQQMRMDHPMFEFTGYFRTVWVGKDERGFLNRTMSIIDDQYHKTLREWREQGLTVL